MRTIIVGDVHGCATELEALLDQLAFSSGDQLVFVGDLVARGPNSLGVLDIARSTGATIVRGNHEQKLLDWLARRERWIRGKEEPSPSKKAEKIGKMHRTVARSLRPIDWTLLQTSVHSLELPEHDILVVHAGVDPTVKKLSRQRPETLLRIRTVIDNESGKKRGKRHVLWGSLYEGPPHIVFGHNAAPGLQLHRWATGLDTGCVYGGRLTALVLAPGQKIPRRVDARRSVLISQPARRVWSIPAHAKRKRNEGDPDHRHASLVPDVL